MLTMQRTDRRVTILHHVGGRFDEKDQLQVVFTCYVSDELGVPDTDHVLITCFNEFNVGEVSDVAKAYRAARLRSLSVRDVVVLDGQAHRCDSFGWTAFPMPSREPNDWDAFDYVTDEEGQDNYVIVDPQGEVHVLSH